EEKLAKAETVQATFRSTFEQQRKNGEKVSDVLTGTILLEKGNKARLEVEGKLAEPLAATVVSDGKTTALVDKDAPNPPPSAVSPRLNKDTTLFLARLGGVTAVMEAQKNLILAEAERQLEGSGRKPGSRESDPAKAMRLGAFKTGPATKIDGRDAGAIQFEIEEVGKTGKAQVTLWFDNETLLPIRRRVFDELKGILIEETFTTFTLDAKIDPAKFELPKETK
ncbi:MAG TPA: outer-membrane lipoprotein carrier protein LolA, partial [Planctomycetota bacterium]|nr:outer-membrane lipoprotein carrier protein LolA [Planctomycetota bacterium]